MKKLDFFRHKINHDKFYLKISICAFFVVAGLILFEKIIGHLPAIGTSLSVSLHYLKALGFPFLTGFAIAYVMNPFMKFFEKIFKGNVPFFRKHHKLTRTVCILLNYIIVIGGTTWILVYLIPELKDSVISFATQLPTYTADMNERVQVFFERVSFINGNDFNNRVNQALQPIIKASQDMPTILETIADNIYIFGKATINFIMAIFISFYMLFDKEHFAKQAQKIVYAMTDEQRAERLFHNANRIHHIFQNFIVGKAVDSLIIGILAFIGLTLMQAPFPLILSLIIGVTNMIPYFGPFIGAIPAAVITLLINPLLTLWVILFILVLQQFDGNFLGPKILGNSLNLNPLWIILAVVIGGAVMGPLGMFIGVPILATIKTFSSEYISRLYRQKYPTEDPLHLPEEDLESPYEP